MWDTAALGDVIQISRLGIAPEEIASGTNYVGLEHVDGSGNFLDVIPVSSGELASTKFKFDSRHVLFGKLRPYLKKTARPNFSGVCSTDILPLLPSKEVDRDYLFHVLRRQSFVDEVTSLCSGANLPRISPKVLARMQIPLPPLPEQRSIAAILDKANALRAKRRKAISKLNQLLQSIFLDMFGDPTTNPKKWNVAQVKDVGEVQGGLQLSRARASLPIQAPYLRVANVYRGRLDLSEIKTFGVTPNELERTSLLKNDILIVEGHGNPMEIGRCAVWDGSIERCSHQNHLIRLRIYQSKATAAFISHFLNSHGGRQGLIDASNTTSGLNTISVRKVRECRIFLPPFDLQQRFSRITERVEYQQRALQRHSDQLDAFFASLQHSVFNGGT